MYIGIDVGGTNTNAVLIENGVVLNTATVPGSGEVIDALLEALDQVLSDTRTEAIEKVVLSTTLITNLIAEKKYAPIGLIIVPGPGLSHKDYYFDTDTFIVSGAIDYRGREIIPLNESEIEKAIAGLSAGGYKQVAVVGKFSVRNNRHETVIAEKIKAAHPDWRVTLGHQTAGQLNFPRRVVSTLLACATQEKYAFFADAVQSALSSRGIKGETNILKADGGTMPIRPVSDVAVGMPIETIFSGPAASTLGVQALIPAGETAVVVDIGGTTTDLALILSGQPLLSHKGALVRNQYTQVRTLAVKSVAVGGDSLVKREGQEILVCPERQGPPACLGGEEPTPTDALRVLGQTEIGSLEKALPVIEALGQPLGLSAKETAQLIIGQVVQKITQEIEQMFISWEQEPAYRVWEVLQKRQERPNLVVGVGGGAPGYIDAIADSLGSRCLLPAYAPVANAIGAAVAMQTVQIDLRADTEERFYTVEQEGWQGEIVKIPFTDKDALDLAASWLDKRAAYYGLTTANDISQSSGDMEIYRKDVFNVVRGWRTTGRIYDIGIQTPRGILCQIEVKGGTEK